MIFLIGRLDLAKLAVNSLVAVNSATTSVYRPKKRGKFPVRLGAALRIRIRSDPNLVCLILIRIITSGSGSNHQFVFTANFHMKQKKDINISALGPLCVNENFLQVLVRFWSKKIRFFFFKFEVGTDLSQQYLEDRAGSESKSCKTKKLSKTILNYRQF